MERRSKNPRVLLDGISELMAEEIESTGHENLLDELSDISEAERSQLEQLRKRLDLRSNRARGNAARSRPPAGQIRQRIGRAFTRCADLPGSVAFRNGAYQTDEDLFRLWDHLCEIGAIDDGEG